MPRKGRPDLRACEFRHRVEQLTGPDGGHRFWTVLPAPYPIPHDGPVGDLLAAAGQGAADAEAVLPNAHGRG
ncbi:hypothetical protein ACFVVA_02040 [Kitasatospora sp. NPDC058048]|uniref:dioxygenase family protein n=1 Tax=Kitasatospora sp. NPDC058048 TaxID=3346313 RepID=UPI0036D99A2A